MMFLVRELKIKLKMLGKCAKSNYFVKVYISWDILHHRFVLCMLKFTVEISQNFVAFPEYMNFKHKIVYIIEIIKEEFFPLDYYCWSCLFLCTNIKMKVIVFQWNSRLLLSGEKYLLCRTFSTLFSFHSFTIIIVDFVHFFLHLTREKHFFSKTQCIKA